MNTWNCDFDIAAFLICLIIFYVNTANKKLPTWQNRTFKKLLYCSTISCVTDIIIVYTSQYWRFPYVSEKLVIINILINILHLFIFNSVPMLYYLFIVTMVIERNNYNIKWKLSVLIPYIITLLTIVPAAVTKILFGFDAQGTYHRQLGNTILYFLCFYYLMASLFVTIKYRKRLTRMQQLVAIFYNILSYITIIVQFLFPHYLAASFTIALCLIFIFLTLQNPYELIDYIAGTFNLKAYYLLIPEYLSYRKEFSIIGIKLSNLKFINDKFGGEEGNRILQQFGEFLTNELYGYPTFHLRGAIFAVIVPNPEMNQTVIEKIDEYFSRPLCINKVTTQACGNFCCLTFPDSFNNFYDMLSLMNYALTETEHTPSERIIYGDTELLSRKKRDTQITSLLTDSIQLQSFEVYYQPVYSVKNGLYESAEALVRMFAVDGSMIPPDDFIPKAEKTGQIISVGEIVLDKTCRMISEQNPQQYGIKNIKVNLSAVQCMQSGLAERLLEIIDGHKIPHSMLNFEITESVAVLGNDIFIRNMDYLVKSGIAFSLDDYGTGYSNIAKLITYHFNVVKVDKSIVWLAEKNEAAGISLKYTTGMIRELKMDVLAEGVETRNQAEHLKNIGVDYFQGYLYSKPLPESDFINFLSNHKNGDIQK